MCSPWEHVESQIMALLGRVPMLNKSLARSTNTSSHTSPSEPGESFRYIYTSTHLCIAEAFYNASGRVVLVLSRKSDGRSFLFPSLQIAETNIDRVSI